MSGTFGGAIVRNLATGAIAGAVAWLLGVPLAQSFLVAIVMLVLGAGRSRLQLHGGAEWPQLSADRDPSVRRELSRLAMEVAGQEGRTTSTATEMLSRLARHRLAQRGIDVSDRGRAESLLGPLAYSVAVEPPDPPLRYYEFERCVIALEGIDHPQPKRERSI